MAAESGDDLQLQRMTDAMYLGDAAVKLMEGTAKRRDITTVMAEVISRVEREIREKTIKLLEITDSRSDEAQKLHFECRVCAGILSHLNQLVSEGLEAEDQFNNQGDRV